MRDVEGFTDRELVGFTAHRSTLADPLVRDFLAVWRREESDHATAIGTYLERYAEARSVDIPPRQLPPPPYAPGRERLAARIGGPVGRVVTAAHMAWGAANELLTLNGYRLLAARSDDPVLAELLRRIAAQEARHYSFYMLQAQWRLAASPTARLVLRRVLGSAWTPVGIGDGYKTVEQFARVLAFLTSSREGAHIIDRMDRRFSALPGFERLNIYRHATATFPAHRPR